MNKIFYWAPFISKVATVKSVINSAESVNRYFNNRFEPVILDAVNEWYDYHAELKQKNIQIEKLNKKTRFNSLNKDGFLRSRIAYWYIFFKSFFPLIKILEKKKPKFLIIHLITSLPLFLFIFKKFDSKLILRISGLPKMTLLRELLWKLAIKNVYKITCPTYDTFRDLSKFNFLKNKLCVIRDPVLNMAEIQKMRKKNPKLNEKLTRIVEKKNFFLSIGRFTKQKNFLFYLKCIPEILELKKDLYFLFIGHGEDKKKFIEISKRLKIYDRIFIIEHTENVHYFMKKAFAFVLPSLWEDPGFVLIEAGFNNCQIISSNCPNGPSEIVKNDGGYLFDSNIKKSLIESVNIFLNESKNKRILKKTNLKKRLKKFTFFYHALKLKNYILEGN